MAINMRKFTVSDGSITAAKLADNAVTETKIASNAVTGAKVSASAIGSTQLADNAVASTKLADGAVLTAKLAASAVDSTKLASAAVTSAALAANAVTSAAIADGAVDLSTAKVAGALPTSKASADLKTSLLVADDQDVYIAGSSVTLDIWNDFKEVRFTKKSGLAPTTALRASIECEMSGSGGGTYVGLFIDTEGTSRAESACPSVGTHAHEFTSINISDLTDGVHVVKIRGKFANSAQNMTIKLTEIFQTW